MKKAYEKHVQEIPEEVRLMLASLDNPIRQAIIVLLNGHTELSFSSIKRELGLGKLTLNYHLKNLYSASLIDHYFRHDFGSQEYSYYSITRLGKRVLTSLISTLIPPSPLRGNLALEEGEFSATGTFQQMTEGSWREEPVPEFRPSIQGGTA